MQSNKTKSKQRYLSPSFKKGVVKKETKEEEFKLNLILNGNDEDDSETASPKLQQKGSKRLSLQQDHRITKSPSKSPQMPSKKRKSVAVEKDILSLAEKTNALSVVKIKHYH